MTSNNYIVHPSGDSAREAGLHAANVRHVFNYDESTGLLTWRSKPARGRVKVGQEAGAPMRGGYLVLQYKGVRFLVHRVIWLWKNWKWPDGDVDHINGMTADNRWCNLRDVSHRTNSENRTAKNKNNTSGFAGVGKSKAGFTARIKVAGKSICLGTFATAEQASAAYQAAKRGMHAGSSR